MAKVKKGEKVRIHGRPCTVKSVDGSKFTVSCGPPAGKGKGRGKAKAKRAGKGRGRGKGKRGLSALENEINSPVPPGTPPKDRAAMKRAKKKLAEAIKYTRNVLADEKKTRREEKLDLLYSMEPKPEKKAKAAKAKRAKTVYSRADPRFDAGLAGTRRRR